MALTRDEIPKTLEMLLEVRRREAARLERIFLYLRDPEPNSRGLRSRTGPLRWLPANAPIEVRRLAEISRVNMMRFVVNASVQQMHVDGYRSPRAPNDSEVWQIWQANKLDAKQSAIHRPMIAYGAAYAIVTPGDPWPVIRAASPRKVTAVYGDDPDWPVYALELRRSPDPTRDLWRLYDDEYVWTISTARGSGTSADTAEIAPGEPLEHGAGEVPVVRYRPTIDSEDDDDDVCGEVEPLIPLQDQINMTTFGLLVAQHFGAFRQRYVLGWLAKTEDEALNATARNLWTFSDPEVKVGEFGQTDLKGYLDSREATLRHLATVSQTPAHELLGQLVNLSAEALAMAESSHQRKIGEFETSAGESHEQTLELAGRLAALEIEDGAAVRWRDTEARSLSQTVDAWGKASTMLGIPPKVLWEKLPGVTDDDLERWAVAAAAGEAIDRLNATLERQMLVADTRARAGANGNGSAAG